MLHMRVRYLDCMLPCIYVPTTCYICTEALNGMEMSYYELRGHQTLYNILVICNDRQSKDVVQVSVL